MPKPFKNIILYIWKFISSKDDLWVILRAAVMTIAAMVLHILFLGAPADSKLRMYCSLGRTIFIILALLQIRHFNKKGTFSNGLKKIAKRVGKLIKSVYRLISQFELVKGRRSNLKLKTEGYTDSQTALEKRRRSGHKRFKSKPWNKMDEKERVRYLYAKRVFKWMKKGYEIDESDTPNEIAQKSAAWPEGGIESEKLIHAYNRVRYNDNCIIDEEITNIYQ